MTRFSLLHPSMTHSWRMSRRLSRSRDTLPLKAGPWKYCLTLNRSVAQRGLGTTALGYIFVFKLWLKCTFQGYFCTFWFRHVEVTALFIHTPTPMGISTSAGRWAISFADAREACSTAVFTFISCWVQRLVALTFLYSTYEDPSDQVTDLASREFSFFFCVCRYATGCPKQDPKHTAKSAMAFLKVKLLDLDPQGRRFDPRCGHDEICAAVGAPWARPLTPHCPGWYASRLV